MVVHDDGGYSGGGTDYVPKESFRLKSPIRTERQGQGTGSNSIG